MMKKHNSVSFDISGTEPQANFSDNPAFEQVVSRRLSRRHFLQGSLALAAGSFIGAGLAGCDSGRSAVGAAVKKGLMGFSPVSINRFDTVTVPSGYSARVILPWGTPLLPGAPAYKADGTNSAADQAMQIGSHHDGMHFFPIDVKNGGQSSTEGLLVMNHEYCDPTILHAYGGEAQLPRKAAEVHKEIAAHGVSVAHIQRQPDGNWTLVENSPYQRRITGMTPMALTGPVRGHDKVKTLYSPDGTATRGTLNNCAHGVTPWGTYLTCEENWALLFVNRDTVQPREHRRYSISNENSIMHWDTAAAEDSELARFNASARAESATADFRNEPNTFGWIVEIDPFNPDSVPVKHTAMGRFAHEGVIFAKAEAGKPLVAYSGDDSRFEYIYKFVSAGLYDPATAGPHLLDSGTLYVARFNEDGSGDWLPLDINDASFAAKAQAAGALFSDQADVLLNTRLAADIAGATKMDRPEWGAVHPDSGEVYFTLTNNDRRHSSQLNSANPRASNSSGHIIRWREAQGQRFNWDIFLLSGDVYTYTPQHQFMLTDDNHHASPDGLWFDPNGLLWIQTDMSGSQLSSGPFGNNQMLVADVSSHQIKRFMVGPVGCEVTGVVMTPDCRTMFVNIQHPGEGSGPYSFSSTWPDRGTRRPRSATVVISKDDGGIIGS
ncbi:PhoX family protein [Rheinheimera oceanensis]|uniref:PhoX family protein n=1 Tax=Rheinheimera oceanensis TaxID=2817449 RepID=UPI001BFD5B69|nr:PhoX family phosphatase [Rheinheimera oceanensis]